MERAQASVVVGKREAWNPCAGDERRKRHGAPQHSQQSAEIGHVDLSI
jgi:hypothetical protein